jgi:hypothetical protein
MIAVSPSTIVALCMVLPLAGVDLDYRMPSGERIPGTHLSDMPGLRVQADRVRAAVRKVYGVDIGNVPVHVVTIEEIRRLHDQVGGRLGANWQLFGFEFEGHVFVRRGLGGVPDETLVHESLHASSRRFNDEALARRVHRIVEGTTQYLTLRALAARPDAEQLKTERNSTYQGSTKIAELIASLVGEDELARAYFSDGFAALGKRIDTVTHGKHRLDKAAVVLEGGNETAAIKILTGER